MLADLTPEQWEGWLNYFENDPWGEERNDQRNAVNSLWSAAALCLGGEGVTLPGFFGPEYTSEQEENVGEAWKRIQAQKQRVLDGKLNSKTSNPANH